MKILDHIRAAIAALLFADVIDDLDRAERLAATLSRENGVLRMALGAVLRGRSARVTLGCPECGSAGAHLGACGIGVAQQAMVDGALLRAERGESDGKA